MASSSSSQTPPDAPLEEEENAADMPLTMAASVVLDQLPKDAHQALETAGELEQAKGTSLRVEHFAVAYPHGLIIESQHRELNS